jgi:hypothetical protein
MTLRELINKTNYKTVFNIIYKTHYSRKGKKEVLAADLSFLSAWKTLSSLEPNPQDKGQIHCIDLTEEPKTIDVCYYSVEEDELYALDFIPWKDLIDLEVRSSISSLPKILAHIIWEITFWGFNPETIEAEGKKISE